MPAGKYGRVIPLVLFHGDRDHVVNSINARHLVIQWGVAYSRNGYKSRSNPAWQPQTKVIRAQAPRGHAYTRTIFHDPEGKGFIEEWIIHEAGHAWVGSGTRGTYTDPLGPDASAEMVRFFLEHPMANENAGFSA